MLEQKLLNLINISKASSYFGISLHPSIVRQQFTVLNCRGEIDTSNIHDKAPTICRLSTSANYLVSSLPHNYPLTTAIILIVCDKLFAK